MEKIKKSSHYYSETIKKTSILFLIVSAILINFSGCVNNSAKKIDLMHLKMMLSQNDIGRIDVINSEIAEIYIKEGSLSKTKYKKVKESSPNFILKIGSIDGFKKVISESQKNIPFPIYIRYLKEKK